jgi:hypothetical protein
MKPNSKLLLLSLLSPLPFVSTALNGAEEDEPVRCVRLSSIDRTEIIDDRNIAFFMRGGDIYVNRLRRSCSQLKPDRAISYRTSTGQICAVDLFSVLDDFGFGLTRVASCGLGMFVPADEEYVDMLKGDEKPAEVKIEEVEVDE